MRWLCLCTCTEMSRKDFAWLSQIDLIIIVYLSCEQSMTKIARELEDIFATSYR